MQGIQIQGRIKIDEIDIPNIIGGFGIGKKSITDKTIAEIHESKTIHIREVINRNRKRFKDGLDIIDLKGIAKNDTLEEIGYSKSSITQSNNLYLLSERGYAKLIKIMDSDLAWEIHDRLMDEYFALREIKPSYMYEDRIKQAEMWIEEEKIRIEQQRLLEEQKPKVEYFNQVIERGHNTSITNAGRLIGLSKTRIFNLLIDKKWIFKEKKKNADWLPYQRIIDKGYMVVKEVLTPNGQIIKQTLVTVKGREKLLEIKNREDL